MKLSTTEITIKLIPSIEPSQKENIISILKALTAYFGVFVVTSYMSETPQRQHKEYIDEMQLQLPKVAERMLRELSFFPEEYTTTVVDAYKEDLAVIADDGRKKNSFETFEHFH